MDKGYRERLIVTFLDAWNSQDAESVVACYTEDVRYRDPNTRGHVEGREALRRYLRGAELVRNEVYFDRAVLAPLMGLGG